MQYNELAKEINIAALAPDKAALSEYFT